MKVFLTGGHGMVGRNFSARPQALEIHAPRRRDLDLRDKGAVLRCLQALQPDVIVHAAGRVGGIAANMADPYPFLIENLEIGSNVIDCAIQAGVPRLLNLGSSCIYPKNVAGQLHEDMILTGPMEPTNEGYALAKVAALRLCEFASRQYGVAYKTIIPCNLYGLFDNFDPLSAHLIPAIIRKVHQAKVEGHNSVEIWGDGSARREFMYSGDLAEFLGFAVDNFDALPNLMNVGVGDDHSVLEYYQAVSAVVGWSGTFRFDPTRPAGMQRKLVSTQRQTTLGWQPCTRLLDGIRLTYDHFLSEQLA